MIDNNQINEIEYCIAIVKDIIVLLLVIGLSSLTYKLMFNLMVDIQVIHDHLKC